MHDEWYAPYMEIRAVVAARVSHVQGDEKTSHLSQAEQGEKYASDHGWTVVGRVEDLNVSAISLGPWDRPDLRTWLTDRAEDFDALVFAKTDRVFRRADDSVDLARWAKDEKKILVIVNDGIKIDYLTPDAEQDPFALAMSRMFLYMASFFAELEGRRFVQRSRDTVAYLRGTDRWGHGVPPFGYRVVDHPTGPGKALDLDPEMQAVLHTIAEKKLLREGKSLVRIADELNREGVLSPMDMRRKKRGDPVLGKRWCTSRLQGILTSPSTQGIKISKGRPVLDKSGNPIRVGPPSFTPDVWDQIQLAVKERSRTPHKRRHSINPILGVGKCGMCGKNLRQRSQTISVKGGRRTHRYYVCARTPVGCPKISVVADWADAHLEDVFLDNCKDARVRYSEYRPGEDHSYELEEVENLIRALREDRSLGLFSSPEDEQTYREQMGALVAKRDLLASRPVVKAGWVEVETDQTYAEVWEDLDAYGRRDLLVRSGVRFIIEGPLRYRVHIPEDMAERVRTGK